MRRNRNRFLVVGLALAICGLSAPALADDVGGDDTGAPGGRRQQPAAKAPAPAPAQAAESDCTWFPDLRCGRSGRWDGFHMPIVAPFQFEDPFVTTSVTPYFMWHDFPSDSVFGGGDLKAVAIQARLAITDRLAFIATRDGYVWIDPDNPLLDDRTGFTNLAAGFKYNFFKDEERKLIASGSLRFEIPIGSSWAFHGQGDSRITPGLSAAWEFLEKGHLIGDFSAEVPFDSSESTILYYHLYADYNVLEFLAPFVQMSGISYVGSGDGSFPVKLFNGSTIPLGAAQTALGTGRFDGVDYANLGSQGVSGNSIVTMAFGLHIPIGKHVTISSAYEFPVTDQEDIFNQRVTTAINLEF
jgi:hypothetical protein